MSRWGTSSPAGGSSTARLRISARAPSAHEPRQTTLPAATPPRDHHQHPEPARRPLTGPPRFQAGRVRAGGGLSRLGRPQAKPAGAAAVPLTGPTSSPREPAPLASDTPLTQVRAAAPPVRGDEVPVAPPAEAPPAPPVRPAALPRQQRGPPLPLTFLRQRSPPMVAPEDQTPTPARTFSSAAGAKAAAGTSALARRPRPVAMETGLRAASPPNPALPSIFRSEGPWGGGAFLTLCAHNFIERSEIKAEQNAE